MQNIILGHRYLVATSVLITLLISVSPASVQQATAQDPGWSPTIIATGQYREQLKSMPIEQRPYRPLHFYGNSVRRNYYRGTTGGQALAPQSTTIRSNPVYSAQRPAWSGNSYRAPTSPVYSYPSAPAYGAPAYSAPTRSRYAPAQSYYPPARNWVGPSW
ncbi:hypothetical protein [Rubripirellula obstinata]|uniref:hypothetical protein n=1 Tax=Rubripirellula obstinata TaxID=406547 RepID=UPI001358AEAA|nr:hypothetical protein [Rubripirellula obstinata]